MIVTVTEGAQFACAPSCSACRTEFHIRQKPAMPPLMDPIKAHVAALAMPSRRAIKYSNKPGKAAAM